MTDKEENPEIEEQQEFFATVKSKLDHIGTAKQKALDGVYSRSPETIDQYYMAMRYYMEEHCEEIHEEYLEKCKEIDFNDDTIELSKQQYMDLFNIIDSVGYKLDIFQYMKGKEQYGQEFIDIGYFDFYWRVFGEGKENFLAGPRGSGKSNFYAYLIKNLLATGRFIVITNVKANFEHHPHYHYIKWLKEALLIIYENSKKNCILQLEIEEIKEQNDTIYKENRKKIIKNPEIDFSTLESFIKIPDKKIMYCVAIIDEAESLFTSQDSVFSKNIKKYYKLSQQWRKLYVSWTFCFHSINKIPAPIRTSNDVNAFLYKGIDSEGVKTTKPLKDVLIEFVQGPSFMFGNIPNMDKYFYTRQPSGLNVEDDLMPEKSINIDDLLTIIRDEDDALPASIKGLKFLKGQTVNKDKQEEKDKQIIDLCKDFVEGHKNKILLSKNEKDFFKIIEGEYYKAFPDINLMPPITEKYLKKFCDKLYFMEVSYKEIGHAINELDFKECSIEQLAQCLHITNIELIQKYNKKTDFYKILKERFQDKKWIYAYITDEKYKYKVSYRKVAKSFRMSTKTIKDYVEKYKNDYAEQDLIDNNLKPLEYEGSRDDKVLDNENNKYENKTPGPKIEKKQKVEGNEVH